MFEFRALFFQRASIMETIFKHQSKDETFVVLCIRNKFSFVDGDSYLKY